jgi:Tfp pilus assembly protein PilW
MVELTVALLAGLIVAMGIIGLSREATNTFHDEARASAAEASLRAAIDRLRADLQRAGYMSTGNIQTDPFIARPLGQTGITSSLAGVTNLQGVHLVSPGPNNFTLSTANGLAPDLIEIAGNLTTSDQFDVAAMPQSAPGQPLTGCVQILLSPTSPAMYRLLAPGGGSSGAGAAGELQAAFQPDLTKQFLVRLVDDSGRSQFLATCNGATQTATGINGSGFPYVMVDANATPIQTANATGTVSALSGYAAGRAWINPVQVVRWEITAANATTDPEPQQYVLASEANDGGIDPNKYDLVRTVLDDTLSATSVSEVVAEYAVDLKFAFDVDTSPSVLPGTQPSPTLTVYAFGSASNASVAAPVSAQPAGGTPQRIRSIRVRLATRAAQPDRTSSIAVAPAYGDTYTYRYCVLPGAGGACPVPPDGVERWARVRTLTTEVALPNQAKNFY